MRKRPSSNKILRFFLLTLSIICLSILLFESLQDYSFDETILSNPVTSNKEEKQSNNITPLPPLTDYAEIIERPLFMEDRRPFVPPEVVTPAKPTTRKAPATRRQEQTFSLSAIIITDDKRIALLESGREKKLHKVSQGDELDGWTIVDIAPNKISMQKGTETREMELAVKSSPKPTRGRAQSDKKNETKTQAVTIIGEQQEANTSGTDVENAPEPPSP